MSDDGKNHLVDGVGVAGVGIFGGRYHPVSADRSDPERAKAREAAKKREPQEWTQAELADWYLAQHEAELRARAERERQKEADAEAIRQRNATLRDAQRKQREAEQCKREVEEKQAASRAAYEAAEQLFEAVLDRYSLPEAERQIVRQKLFEAGKEHDLEMAAYLAAEILARKH